MLKTVTAIITVYNGEKYITEAIESILNQTVTIDEIIVVDDGSTDETVKKVKAFSKENIIIISQKNQGQAKALNVGIIAAKSFYLTFLDADDVWLPNKTAIQLIEFDKYPELELCFGYIQEFISNELHITEKQKLICKEFSQPAKMKQTMMIKKELFNKWGLFPEVPTMDFIAWYAIVKKNIRCEMLIDTIVAKRRLHVNNISRRIDKSSEIIETFKLILKQKRKDNTRING